MTTPVRIAANGKARRNGGLPHKTCAVCGRPFSWRRKWAASWKSVRYCSERCRRLRKAIQR